MNPLPALADRAAPAPHCCRVVATVVEAVDQAPIEGARLTATWYRADAWTIHAGATGTASDDQPIEAFSDIGGHVRVDVDAHHRGRWKIQVSHPEREAIEPRFLMIPEDTASFDLGRIELRRVRSLQVRTVRAGMPLPDVAVYAFAPDDEDRFDKAAPQAFLVDVDAPDAVTDRAGVATLRLPHGSHLRLYALAKSTKVTWRDFSVATDSGDPRRDPAIEIELPAPQPTYCRLDAQTTAPGSATLRLTGTRQGFELLLRVAPNVPLEIPDPWTGERAQAWASMGANGLELTAFLLTARPADGQLVLTLTAFQRTIEVRWDPAETAGNPASGPALVTLGLLRKGLGEEICDMDLSVPVASGRTILRPVGRAAHRIVAFHPDHGIVVSPTVPEGGSTEPVVLDWAHTVVPAAPVVVEVTGPDGSPVRDATATVLESMPPELWPSHDVAMPPRQPRPTVLAFDAQTGTDGLARFRGVPCGTATVQVRTDGTALQRLDNVQIQPGPNRLAIRLAPAASVTVVLRHDASLASLLPSTHVLVRDNTASPGLEAVVPDATGTALIRDLSPGPAEVTVETMGQPLRLALHWWDPYHVFDMRWVGMARATTVLQPGAANRLELAIPDERLRPAVHLQPAGTTGDLLVAVTHLLPNSKPEETPRTRTNAWNETGLDIAALPAGSHVLELLAGSSPPSASTRSWMVVDGGSDPIVAAWPGASSIDLAASGVPEPVDQLVPWHQGRRIPWLALACPTAAAGSARTMRLVDGWYQLMVAGSPADGVPVLHVADGAAVLAKRR
jgi:hypothetical protein